jgi:hypothetical protein
LQRVYKALSGIENLARCTPAKVRESSEWTSIVNSAEENRENICKALDGKLFFSALYGTYAVTLNKLKAILKVSAQEGQSGAVNKTSVESTAQDDDFQEIKRRKRHISNNALQTAKKLTKPVPTSAAVKMSPKALLICNFFAPLRTTDKDTVTTEVEYTLPEQEAPRKPGRPPPTVMTSTTNLIQIQSNLNDKVKRE